jgi:DNA adenine methylase
MRTYLEVKYRPLLVARTISSMSRSKREYLRLRGTAPNTLERSDRAARFIYLNRFCFNGIYRTNNHGDFNVPYGARGTGSLPSEEYLRRISQALRSAQLKSKDFEQILHGARPGDFVYLDPPYRVSKTRVFNEYQPSLFSDRDVNRLRLAIRRLDSSNVKFLLSYIDSPEADFLGSGFEVRNVKVRRNVAGFIAKRSSSQEVLISNFLPFKVAT